jgi:hypothetical protein
MKLSKVQAAMVDSCLAMNAAWVTSAGSDNDAMLQGWCDKGWATTADPPSGSEGLLTAYHITEAGRAALKDATHAE